MQCLPSLCGRSSWFSPFLCWFNHFRSVSGERGEYCGTPFAVHAERADPEIRLRIRSVALAGPLALVSAITERRGRRGSCGAVSLRGSEGRLG